MNVSTTAAARACGRVFRSRGGTEVELPLFLPVYQPRTEAFRLALWQGEPKIDGIIVNAYFLYKQRELRKRLLEDSSLKTLVGFDGLVTTDSGAFQGLTRQLYLSNKDIVRFQDRIGSDVIAPLDLITPPGDNRTLATDKLRATEKRIEEALGLVEHGILAGVQQGGRFLDLRHESINHLVQLNVAYVAIGSLVPFFNANHDLSFPAAVICDARNVAGPSKPIHIYGAGDPCELPFFFKCGATIFDSASYGRYSEKGWYMTPYGALRDLSPVLAGEFTCRCPCCETVGAAKVIGDGDLLARHNLWTIMTVVGRLRQISDADETLDAYLEDVLAIHNHWFPESRLGPSWRRHQDRNAASAER